MSEKTELQVASTESVAFQLTMDIALKEEMFKDKATYRQQVLDLYAECLLATTGYRNN